MAYIQQSLENLSATPNPPTGSIDLAFDLDAILKAKDEAGVITPIGSDAKTTGILWLDPINGNDTSAVASGNFSINHPFKTANSAKANAVAGNLICVLPGNLVAANILKDEVNWYFFQGAKVTCGSTLLLSNSGAPVVCSILGYGEFIGVGGADIMNVGLASTIYFEYYRISCQNTALFASNGKITIRYRGGDELGGVSLNGSIDFQGDVEIDAVFGNIGAGTSASTGNVLAVIYLSKPGNLSFKNISQGSQAYARLYLAGDSASAMCNVTWIEKMLDVRPAGSTVGQDATIYYGGGNFKLNGDIRSDNKPCLFADNVSSGTLMLRGIYEAVTTPVIIDISASQTVDLRDSTLITSMTGAASSVISLANGTISGNGALLLNNISGGNYITKDLASAFVGSFTGIVTGGIPEEFGISNSNVTSTLDITTGEALSIFYSSLANGPFVVGEIIKDSSQNINIGTVVSDDGSTLILNLLTNITYNTNSLIGLTSSAVAVVSGAPATADSAVTVPYSNQVGTAFVFGEMITDITSTNSGTVVSDDGSTLVLKNVTGVIASGNNLVGSANGTTADVNGQTVYTNIDLSAHYFTGSLALTSLNANEAIGSITNKTSNTNVIFRPAFVANWIPNSVSGQNIFLDLAFPSGLSVNGGIAGFVELEKRSSSFFQYNLVQGYN